MAEKNSFGSGAKTTPSPTRLKESCGFLNSCVPPQTLLQRTHVSLSPMKNPLLFLFVLLVLLVITLFPYLIVITLILRFLVI